MGTTVPFTPPAIMPNDFAFDGQSIGLMQDAGLNAMRVFFTFPFEDENMRELSASYRRCVECAELYAASGIQIIGMIANPGMMSVDDTGQVSYVRQYPDWLGPVDGARYFEVLEASCEFVADQTKGLVTYWQIANEPDMDTFIGELAHEQNERWLEVAARGVKKGHPAAMCGINLAGFDFETLEFGLHPYARRLIEKLYLEATSNYDFLGLDGYFGSWGRGEPDDWIRYIDDAHRLSERPIVIHEWGYSTLQRGVPRSPEDEDRFFNSPVCRDKDWDAIGPAKWRGQDHSEALQAAYIEECVKIFAEHPAVIGNLFFQWQDPPRCWQCGAIDCPAECGWGCIRSDGTPKPGYYALVKANKEHFGDFEG